MAFPTGGGSSQSLAFLLNDVLSKAAEIKKLVGDFRTKIAAQNVLGRDVFTFLVELREGQLYLEIRAQAPGLREYAQTIFDNLNLEIVSEFQTMNAAINAAIVSIDTQTPSQLSTALYTPANTTALRVQLQSIVDAID